MRGKYFQKKLILTFIRLKSLETSKMSEQNEWLAERNSLQEEVQKWKSLLQQRTQEARDRIQEMKNELLEQQEEERAVFRVCAQLDMITHFFSNKLARRLIEEWLWPSSKL